MNIEYRGISYEVEISEGTTQFRRNIRVFNPSTKIFTKGGCSRGIGLLYTWNSGYDSPRAYQYNKGTVPKYVVMTAFRLLFAKKDNPIADVAITVLESTSVKPDRFA